MIAKTEYGNLKYKDFNFKTVYIEFDFLQSNFIK